MDDGVLETILVKNVPKRTFARLFPAYSAGEYWKFPHIARMVTSRQVVITASPGEADIVTCLDRGEPPEPGGAAGTRGEAGELLRAEGVQSQCHGRI